MQANIPTANTRFTVDSLRQSSVYKPVFAVYTSNTPVAIWTPATGKKFKLKGIYLKPSAIGALTSSLVGQQVVLYDSAAAAAPTAATIIVGIATVNTSPQPAGSWVATAGEYVFSLFLNEGYTSVAANNVLNLGLAVSAGTSLQSISNSLVVSGLVFGEEV